jgi:excisionase family DNA binding protein
MQGQGININGTSRQNVTPLLVSPRQAARMLSVCERTLYSLEKAGEIAAVRRGRLVRYSVDELRGWIERASEKKCEGGHNGT